MTTYSTMPLSYDPAGDVKALDAHECPACEGRGGELENDMQGDGVWAMPMASFVDCPTCLGDEKCPGCMAPIEATAIMRTDIDEWTCPLCSWHIDWDRLQPGDVDWGY